MLFSIIMGLLTTAYFVLKAALVKIKFALTSSSGRNTIKGRKRGIVIYSEGNRYWNVFGPVLEELNRRGVSALYYTSQEDDLVFQADLKSIESEYIGKGNKAFAKLNFLEADICLMTTPGLDVYQLKRSRGVGHYAHVLHSVDDATSYRLFGLDYFDSVLLSGEYQKIAIRALERKREISEKELVVVGCPYLDVLRSRVTKEVRPESDEKVILVAPSWGPSALLSRYGEKLLDPLIRTKDRIIIRPHPQSLVSEAPLITRLVEKYAETPNVEWDYSNDNVATLGRSDVMISDFSGVIFDYAFLFNRPFFFAAADYDDAIYDSSDLDETPWKFQAIASMGIELSESMFADIGEYVRRAARDPELNEKRKIARDTAWQCRGEASSRIADFLIEKQREISC